VADHFLQLTGSEIRIWSLSQLEKEVGTSNSISLSDATCLANDSSDFVLPLEVTVPPGHFASCHVPSSWFIQNDCITFDVQIMYNAYRITSAFRHVVHLPHGRIEDSTTRLLGTLVFPQNPECGRGLFEYPLNPWGFIGASVAPISMYKNPNSFDVVNCIYDICDEKPGCARVTSIQADPLESLSLCPASGRSVWMSNQVFISDYLS
jgi:hypothetical protein